jgi:hypothetical protein
MRGMARGFRRIYVDVELNANECVAGALSTNGAGS